MNDSEIPKAGSEAKEPSIDELIDGLRDALANPELQTYIEESGPLLKTELPEKLVTSPEFASFVEVYSWPDAENAGAIEPVRDYDDAEDFWENVYQRDDDAPEKYLNNFKSWLRVEPKQELDFSQGTLGVYGLNPALHRAHVLAEPLFTNLRLAITQTPGYMTLSQAEVMEKLGSDNPEVPEAAFAAYRLLGRLITKDDLTLTLRAMGDSSDTQPDITEAHRYLST